MFRENMIEWIAAMIERPQPDCMSD